MSINLEINNVYNMDCMNGLKEFPDNYFNLAIVDPPYGINAPNMTMGSGKRNGKLYKSTAQTMKGRLNSGGGKLKNRVLNQSNCLWDNRPPTQDYFDGLQRVSKNQIIFGGNYFSLPPTRGIGFWDKLQPWENFSQFELIWTSFDCPAFVVRQSSRAAITVSKRFILRKNL